MDTKRNRRGVVFSIPNVRKDDEQEYEILLDLDREEFSPNTPESNLRSNSRHGEREAEERTKKNIIDWTERFITH